MSWFTKYLRSSVGAKHVMAISGFALVLFVLVHMLGNLQMFIGRDAVNDYAQSLASTKLLWVARAGLLFMVVVHIAAAVRLTRLNRAARPHRYQVFRPRRAPFYSRVMPWTGLILLAFIVFHLLHFTFGAVQHDHYALIERLPDGTARHDVYGMTVLGFQTVPVAISYIIAMAFLCMHLAHGVSSMFQSLGLNHPKYSALIRNAGPVFALIIFVGNTSMPLAVMLGAVTL